VSRIPIRVRITAAFALAMLLMLVGAAAFVYVRLRDDLDDRVNALLRARSTAAADLATEDHLPGLAIEDREESFVQLLDQEGRLIDHAGAGGSPAVGPALVAIATSSGSTVEADVVGVDGRARLFIRRLDDSATILVVGESLRDRNEALASVVTSFTVGGVAAVALASIVGSVLAHAGLAPVEAMRRRASEISLRRAEDGLPLPLANDEIRRLGITLNEMLARLRASFEREARFVADASHELRTPIAVVRTELDGALRTGDIGARARDALIAAVEECDRLAQLADDLLVLARADAGRVPVRPQQVDLALLLTRVRDRFADRAAQRDRAIELDVPEPVSCVADPERLRQAVSNLIDNALRHGNGIVTLRARQHAATAAIDVADQGHGMPAGFAAHAFERFSRVDRTQDGAGLGLAIVAAIAEAHHGTVEIIEPPATDDAGTLLRITLQSSPVS
jgi:two-component system OmpR family sensor kinase